ncbi:MAG: hypothetical protein ACPGU1_07420 [Myxococcota bacterium]
MTWSAAPLDETLRSALPAWGALGHATTSWDLTLRPTAHAELSLGRLMGGEERWAISHSDGRIAGAWLSSLPWDTSFFGLPMATIGLEGQQCAEAIRILVPKAINAAARLGIQHVRVAQRAGAYEAIEALQALGFRVRWVSTQITCDTRRLPQELAPFPAGLTCVDATPEHLGELAAVSRQIGAYCWPEYDPVLPEQARRAYVMQRITNCITTDYADTAVVALWRGRVVGFHASAVATHALQGSSSSPYAYVRDTFVSPKAPPNVGSHLIRAALHGQIGLAQQVTGRVRLDGRAMINTALDCGYRVTGDEILFSAHVNAIVGQSA